MENVIYNELLSRGYSVDVGVMEMVERREDEFLLKEGSLDFWWFKEL